MKNDKRNKIKRKIFIKIENIYNNFSKEDLIEIQSEAYYRALKKIDQAGKEIKENKEENVNNNRKKFDNLLFVLNVLFFPFIINKRFKVNSKIYDNLLVFSVSEILNGIGFIIWIIGIVTLSYGPFYIENPTIMSVVLIIVMGIFIILIGSMFIISGGEFGKESDSSKIYAFSASIFALVSCVVGIIALLKM